MKIWLRPCIICIKFNKFKAFLNILTIYKELAENQVHVVT